METPRIVIIDDSSDDRRLVRRAIEKEFRAPEIVEVDSPEGLEEILRGERFDAVISDYHLGWSDGLTVVQRIREAWPDTAAVVFTGTGTEEVAVRAMKDGVDDYVVKAPKHFRRLPLAVRRAIERHRQRLTLTVAEAEVERQARHMELLQAVTAVANEMDDFEEALRAALERIQLVTGWPLGHVYVVSDDVLEPTGIWASRDQSRFAEFEQATSDQSIASPNGLVGRVHRTGRPAWIADLAERVNFGRSEAATAVGLRAALAVPVVVASETVAVLELFHTEPVTVDEGLVEVLRQAGVQLGRVAERARSAAERARIESKARGAQKMEAVGRLAGGIAHDFNNLITVLLMESRAAQDVEGVPVSVRSALRVIFDTSERATLLTRQLLSFARERPPSPTLVGISEVVGDLRPMLERILGERHELQTHRTEDAARVRIDRSELDQVLVNLVVNARDAMPDGGRIIIETERREVPRTRQGTELAEDCVLLHVTDEGHGIPEAIQDRIFEPFFSTKGENGTGLGLSICYGVVNAAGGEFRVYSEEGVGSTFSVVLPCAEARSSTVSTRPRNDRVPTGTETILVVEDDDALRRVTARALQAHGYTTVESSDGEDALRRLSDPGRDDPRIDLVVSDVVLPGIGGPELIQLMRQRRPGLPALLTSGYSEQMVRGRADLGGPVVIIQKPYSVATLAREVRSVLDGDAAEGGVDGPGDRRSTRM